MSKPWEQLPIDGMGDVTEDQLAAKEAALYALIDELAEAVDRLTIQVARAEMMAEQVKAERKS